MSRRENSGIEASPAQEMVPRDPPPDLQVFCIEVASSKLLLVTYELPPEEYRPPLTEAEREVLRALWEGKTNLQIATERGRSPRTVANQVTGLLRKLGVSSRIELVTRYAPPRG